METPDPVLDPREERGWRLAYHVPGLDDELDHELGYDLDPWLQRFVTAYVTTRLRRGGAIEAVRIADAQSGYPRLTNKAAQATARRLLDETSEEGMRLRIVLRNRCLRAARLASLQEAEFYLGVRYLIEASMGHVRVRRTLIRTAEDGTRHLDDVYAYEPNMPALARALEMVGRNLGKLDDRLRITDTSHEEALKALDKKGEPDGGANGEPEGEGSARLGVEVLDEFGYEALEDDDIEGDDDSGRDSDSAPAA